MEPMIAALHAAMVRWAETRQYLQAAMDAEAAAAAAVQSAAAALTGQGASIPIIAPAPPSAPAPRLTAAEEAAIAERRREETDRLCREAGLRQMATLARRAE